MALKGPKGAHPTVRGWVHPKTGELLKSQKISQQVVDDWHGVVAQPEITEDQLQDMIIEGKIQAAMKEAEFQEAVRASEADEAVKDFNEDGVVDNLEKMSKKELEEYGRSVGIELDRRFLKTKMLAQLKEHLND